MEWLYSQILPRVFHLLLDLSIRKRINKLFDKEGKLQDLDSQLYHRLHVVEHALKFLPKLLPDFSASLPVRN